MNFIKRIGIGYFLMLILTLIIILVAEYIFLSGDHLHGLFIGLWAPVLVGIMIFLKLVENERR
ncbi:MAG: hypothetical protein QNJ57_09265 [Flavobacteriaceae bacterium]|nr:hypothetical protein [Flavobacteriaceae bacterium]